MKLPPGERIQLREDIAGKIAACIDRGEVNAPLLIEQLAQLFERKLKDATSERL